MKQLNFTLLLTLLMSMVGTKASAYDFAVENSDGVMIYYEYYDDGVAVTYKSYHDIYNAEGEYAGYAEGYEGVTTLNIPETVTYNNQEYSVVCISERAFFGCSGLTSVTIPNSVFRIGYEVFSGCTGLTSITIPNSVSEIYDRFSGCTNLSSISVENGNPWYDSRDNCNAIIETDLNILIVGCKNTSIPSTVTSIEGAFRLCSSLKNITIPNSVITIDAAFEGCTGLTSITIPNSVMTIQGDAFYNCTGLTSITIPNSVTFIENAFLDCSNLSSINVEKGNPCYDSRDNCNAIIETATNTLLLGCKNTTIPSTVTSIGGFALSHCAGLTNITIPNSVTTIGDGAFGGCSSLTNVTIPSSVTYIGSYAFGDTPWFDEWSENQENGLLYRDNILWGWKGAAPSGDIVVNNGTRLIAGAALYDTNITSITIPNSVKSIGASAFLVCNRLKSITIPNSVTTIGERAFSGCSSLTSFTIPNSVTSIGMHAFYGCRGLTSVTIPNSITTIETGVFYGCSGLTSITIPNSVTSIKYNAFSGCSGLTSVTIPNSVTSIGYQAFYACGLTSVIIPNSVTSIERYAFQNCSGLTSVTIGNSVTSIKYQAFYGCNNLVTVEVKSSTPVSIGGDTFTNRTNATLYVPQGSKAAYMEAKYWKQFKEIVEVSDYTDVSSLDNVIYVEPMEVRTGSEAVISFKMKNTADVRGFQFDLYLPDGVTVVKSAKGKIQGALSTGRLPDEDEHQLTFSEHDGFVRFLCSSQYPETFTGTTGEIATLKVNIAEGIADGDYAIELKDMKLTETDISKYYETSLIKSKMTIFTYVTGDISGDGEVDVSDYTGVANYIHGSTPAGFNSKAADVDNSGAIDVSDYTGIANIIHTGSIYGKNNARSKDNVRKTKQKGLDPQ